MNREVASSEDLHGARVKRSFRTALKFRTSSLWSTVAVYGLLSDLPWRVIERWPDESFTLAAPVPPPEWLPRPPKHLTQTIFDLRLGR